MNQTTYLKDYQSPAFRIKQCEMAFELDPESTLVTVEYDITRNDESASAPLILDGEDIELVSVQINGEALSAADYRIAHHQLIIPTPPAAFKLRIVSRCSPAKNTSLSGLYQSGDMLCTQCEAEGFRRICYSLDRPDVLSQYSVTLRADKAAYPVLLCNGNLVDQGESGDQHWVKWVDPFPKPSYLFALVAGSLQARSGQFTTMGGRKVDLHIYTRPEDHSKSQHALDSLIRSMQWDETAYGREYDLNIYNIVAVNDFNMGAMENKSLNIFNTKYVLAKSDIATDTDYHNIEGVIGHEYFHNWSGNRITCRDWFQLSLKEGFTVLRDQQFSADMGSAGVQRVNDVNVLRNSQFREDAGPMAHPVRPDSYEEINNFYTTTIYNKGAEVVRMLQTLLGDSLFRQGTDHYFDKYDGQAVTTDDFVSCMEAVSGRDLRQFRNWYCQAGTPEVTLQQSWDQDKQQLQLTLSQQTPDTPGQSHKAPFHIPLRLAAFNQSGNKLKFSLGGQSSHEAVLELTDSQQQTTLQIIGAPIEQSPIISMLRGFSAPIKLHIETNATELALLMANDDDPFNRWEAGQRLGLTQISRQFDTADDTAIILDTEYSQSVQQQLAASLNDPAQNDPALTAQVLTLPGESFISQGLDVINPDRVHAAREGVIKAIAKLYQTDYLQSYHANAAHNTGQWTQSESAHRALRDHCLSTLSRLDTTDIWQLAEQQYQQAQCMTDTISALGSLVNSSCPDKGQILNQFYSSWQDEPLVVNKWFTLQAMSSASSAFDEVQALTRHSAFDMHNPNKVYALLASFMHANATHFHHESGRAYEFGAQWVIKIDSINPQVASRLVSAFNQWRRYDAKRQQLMQNAMEKILAQPGLSSDVSEIVHKALA